MSEPTINVTDTNSASDFSGLILGIERQRFFWVPLALVAGLFLFWWLHENQTPLWVSIGVSALPVVATGTLLILFFQGRPPAYFVEFIECCINHGDATPLGETKIMQPLPDCYLNDGLILYGGPRRGGVAAKGFRIDLPSLQHASSSDRNLFQSHIRQILKMVPTGWSIQFLWWNEADYRKELLAFRAGTEKTKNSRTKLIRNLHFLSAWDQMIGRKLRRERMAIVLCRPLEDFSITATLSPEAFYGEHLNQLKSEFREFEGQFTSVLASLGGKVSAMGDADHYHLFARKLNPSFEDRPSFDCLSTFEASQSISTNCLNSEIKGVPGGGFLLDGYYHGVLVLKRWPSQTYPTIVQKLTGIATNGFEISVNLSRLSADAIASRAQKEVDRNDQQLAQKPDERLSVSRSKRAEQIRRLSKCEIVPFEVEYTIVVRAKLPSELAEKMLTLKSAIHGLGGAGYIEASLPASARNVFLRTMPGCGLGGRPGVRLYAEDTFLADMLPVSSSFTGHLESAEALYQGNSGNLVGVRNVSGNGTPLHQIWLGGIGAGKSFALLNELQQSEPIFHKTFIIEEGLSHASYTRSFGLEPVILRLEDRKLTFNFFDTRQLPLTSTQLTVMAGALLQMSGIPDDQDKAQERMATISKMVFRLCHDYAEEKFGGWPEKVRTTHVRNAFLIEQWSTEKRISFLDAFLAFRELERSDPAEASRLLAETNDEQVREFGATNSDVVFSLVYSVLSPEEHLTLSSFQEYMELEGAGDKEPECRRIATLLTPWCRGRNYGSLFDGPSSISLSGPVVHFELGLLPEAAKEVKNLIGFLIINEVRQQILSLPRELRKRVIFEEISRFLTIPGADRIAREAWEQFRKTNTQAIAVFQQYGRLADSPICGALMGNTSTFFIFNTGDKSDVERLAKDLGLSKVAQESILRYSRPDQQTGQSFSEFCYFHKDPVHPICGTVRYIDFSEQTKPQPNTQG